MSQSIAEINSEAPAPLGALAINRRSQPLLPDVGVIALVPDAWDDLWQPRHHVLSRLARYFNVVWMEPGKNWLEMLRNRRRTASFDCGSGIGGDTLPPAGMIAYPAEIWLPKLHRWSWLDGMLLEQRLRRARNFLTRIGCQKIILYMWRSTFSRALDYGPFDLTCYHIDDEYSFSAVEVPLDGTEQRLIKEVGQVFLHSPGLLEKKGRINPHTEFVPNGVDYEAYSRESAEPPDLARIPHPRIGYTGFIKRHLDWPVLIRLSQDHPEWSFVFVGPQSPHLDIVKAIEQLRRQPNVYFLGPKSTEILSNYPQHFDVCIMPYQANDYTKYVYPLKLHEYLASGRPTVGTRIRTLAEFTTVVRLASTLEEWSAAIQESLSSAANSPERRAKRQSVAQQHDWQTLVLQIAQVMAERLGSDYSRRLSHLLLTGKRSIDLAAYWASPRERERVTDLLDIVPKGYSSILDIGGRDGHISALLTSQFESVTCLDLEKPNVSNEKVVAVKGDVTKLDYPDNHFDVVLCAEVLEHIPPDLLARACSEITRVAKHAVVVGVPYKQDRRVGRTTCRFCGRKNPCWGHVNAFDAERLQALFNTLVDAKTTFVGQTRERTNRLSAFLMDLGGNPWGTYEQEEGCIYCGSQLIPAARRTILERVCSGVGVALNKLQAPFVPARPNWVYMVFRKHGASTATGQTPLI
jgi:glycosyltransferase involved in cell wall biosynthesis